MSRSVLLWYFRISRNATVPGRKRFFFRSPSAAWPWIIGVGVGVGKKGDRIVYSPPSPPPPPPPPPPPAPLLGPALGPAFPAPAPDALRGGAPPVLFLAVFVVLDRLAGLGPPEPGES